MSSGNKRRKQMEQKRARKASYGQAGKSSDEKKELNPKVPYQRRKLARMRGEPMIARPPRIDQFISIPDGASAIVRWFSPGFKYWLNTLTRK